MTQQDEKPDWLKNYVPTPSPKWKKGMPSPNPAGRPKGGLNKATKIARALDDEGMEVVQVVIDAALDGDMQACSIILNRIAPALRSQSQKVEFDFDPELPIGRQVEQVLAAVAAGQVAPDIAQSITAMIGTLSTVRATEELEQRITTLEAKAI